jgi:hypothetical protein
MAMLYRRETVSASRMATALVRITDGIAVQFIRIVETAFELC